MNLPSQGHNHAEHALLENIKYIIYFIYCYRMFLCANLSGSQIFLSRHFTKIHSQDIPRA